MKKHDSRNLAIERIGSHIKNLRLCAPAYRTGRPASGKVGLRELVYYFKGLIC